MPRGRYRRRFDRATVDQLAARDGAACHLCGRPIDLTADRRTAAGASVDHVTPWAHGGTDDPENLRLAHTGCNKARGANPPTDVGPQSRAW